MATVDIIVRMIDQTGVASNKAISNMKSMTKALAPYAAIIGTIAVSLKQAVDETLKYDNAVRQLAAISGVGAEESSRLLQVLDDFKISSEDITTATRSMTREGLSPTLDTLAQLSDQYNKLNPGQERADFLMQNFGKSGLKFAEAMEKGGDALHKMGAEVEKSLIRTDAQIAKTRLAELALDRYQDKVQSIKVTLGSGLIGLLDGSTAAITKQAQEIYKAANGANFNTNMMSRYTDAQRAAWEESQKLATEQYLLAQGMDITSGASQNATQSMEEQAQAAKELSEANSEFLNMVSDITDRNRDYQDSIAEINQKYADGEISIDERQASLEELAVKQEEASRRMILAMLEQELAADGLTAKETDALLQLGAKWGIYSETAITEARRARDEVNALLAGIKDETVTVTVQTLGGYSQGSQQYDRIAHPGRASGGGGGGMTWVGENGRELVNLPPNSQVYNNAQSEKIAGGGNAALLEAVRGLKMPSPKDIGKEVALAFMQMGNG